MNKTDVKINDFEAKELKQLKSHMHYMYQDLRKWGIKSCKVIDLYPEVKVKEVKLKEGEKAPKEVKHIGYHIIQGTHKSPTKEIFNFQIVREHGVFKDNGAPQYKVILQYGANQVIETYPQTNPDLKAILMNYLYTKAPLKMKLHSEEKATPKKASKPVAKKSTPKPTPKPTPTPKVESKVEDKVEATPSK